MMNANSGQPLRVLWVSPKLSCPPRSGADLRTARLMRALAEEAEVRLLIVGTGDPAEVTRATGVEEISVFARAGKLGKGMTALLRRWPRGVAAAWSRVAATEVAAADAAGWLIVVDHPQMAPYLPPGRRHILFTHNAEAQLAQDGIRGRAVSRLLHRWDALCMRRLEKQAVARAGQVIVVSPDDAAQLATGVVVPNGADLPQFVPELPTEGLVLFVGSLGYLPNREAIDWWCGEIWPLMPAGTPKLTVIGSGSKSLPTRLLSHPGVSFLGEVPDLAPWLARAAVVAVPLLVGGGTRLKVLEALAWGRPIVSTSKGVEGLGLRDGVHALLRDDASGFAEGVRLLLTDRVLASDLAARGVTFAQPYSWVQIAPTFTAALIAQNNHQAQSRQ